MKTYEEIVAEIRKHVNIGFDYSDGKDKTALAFYDSDAEIILQALEKQIPAPPKRRSDEYDGEYGYCPSCDGIISDYSDMRVCRHCGQKIQWQKEWVWK